MDVFDKFTTRLKSVLIRSATFAHDSGANSVFPEHLLWGLSTEKGSISAEILSRSKFNASILEKNEQHSPTHEKNYLIRGGDSDTEINQKKTDAEIQIEKQAYAQIELYSDSQKLISQAVGAAAKSNHKFIGTEHLLFAIATSSNPKIMANFNAQKINLKSLKRHIEMVLKNASNFSNITNSNDYGQTLLKSRTDIKNKKGQKNTPTLDSFGKDLSNPKILAKCDPLIGREKELQRVVEILLRRTKNNPILLGEPGVGKTAIIEGLAQKIADRDVPLPLLDKRIVSLDLGLIVAGTLYRGEFENRLKMILEEAQNTNIILFIDEIHNIMGAGSASGSLDAASMLKPALARGEIKIIGATTFADYKKFIETDGALERRFETINVNEPGKEETKKILMGLRPGLEKFHTIRIGDDAINAAIDLSVRYREERRLPDKAIDLLDEASSAKKISAPKTDLINKFKELNQKLAKLEQAKYSAVQDEQYTEAMTLKSRESELQKELSELEARIKDFNNGKNLPILNRQDIAQTLEKISGVSLPELETDLSNKMRHMLKNLKSEIRGQDEILDQVVGMLTRANLGINSPDRPLASFLFLGPSGVGKTLTAEKLCHYFFGSRESFIRLDMSELKESFQMSKLIGAPAGYVGYRENNKLTDRIKNHPYSLILFDEVEKAHPDVLNLLLQILENGEITDASGRSVNFKNTIIVMTSNIGTNESSFQISGFDGYEKRNDKLLRTQIEDSLKSSFTKELLGRIDEVLIFKSLKYDDLISIASLELNKMLERMSGRLTNNEISLLPDVANHIAKLSLNTSEGARKIRKLLSELIEVPLANHLLKNKIEPKLNILLESGEIVIK